MIIPTGQITRLGLNGHLTNELVWENGMNFAITTANTGEPVIFYWHNPAAKSFYHSDSVKIMADQPAGVICQGNLDRLNWV